MKVEPLNAPAIVQPSGTTATDARARAVAKFLEPTNGQQAQAQPQTHPVQNPTQVSPEELSAIKASEIKGESETAPQKDTSGEAPAQAEAAPEATNPPEEMLSSQYAALARKEKALRQRAQELKVKEDAIKATEAAKTPAAKPEDFMARLAQDPIKVLSEAGVTFEQLISASESLPKPEEAARNAEFKRLQDEIKSIREAQEQNTKAAQEAQDRNYQQAVSQIRSEANRLISLDPSYQAIKESGSVNDVVGLITRTFSETGELMTVEDAANAVEDYLVDRITRVAKLEKIQKRLRPAQPPVSKQPEPKQQQQPQMKTLTNAVGTSRQLSARERAILAFKGELK